MTGGSSIDNLVKYRNRQERVERLDKAPGFEFRLEAIFVEHAIAKLAE